jgi:hypothetical protein
MKQTAQRNGTPLVAAAFMKTGIHPYTAIAFTNSDAKLEAVETAMFWGQVNGKWVSTINSAAYSDFVRAVEQLLACRPGAPLDSIFGAVLVYWKSSGEHVVCSGDWGSEQAAQFGQLLNNLLPQARQTYKP